MPKPTIHEFYKGMREHFNIDHPEEYLDELYLLNKEVKIDLVKFVRWLVAGKEDYRGIEDWSMADEVEKRFGKEARRLIASLL
jgi:hypothetical protein